VALLLAPGGAPFSALPANAQADAGAGTPPARADSTRWSSFLPLLRQEAERRGIELPLPFGAGLVYYHLSRDIAIPEVRVGRNGAPPASVGEFARLASHSTVENVNLKLDCWLLPFVNLYLIGGYLWNTSDTRIDVTLPPLLPNGPTRRRQLSVPTKLEGSVGGIGMTLAGGYGPFFMTYDVNAAEAELGFDDRFKAVVTSIRCGWNGKAGSRPLRAWLSATDWNTFATATGTVADPDGGSLAFEVDQGPAYRYTYGLGAAYSPTRRIDLALDAGTDWHGGWYLALVPVLRF
jgi:hypothetical protein